MTSKEPKVVSDTNLTEFFRERVQETMTRQQVPASQLLEFYLVNLLQEYKKSEKLFEKEGTQVVEKPLALLLAQALDGDLNTRILYLKKLGDSALYVAGFFAESIRRKLVDLDYYIKMGGGAYQSLSLILRPQKTFSELYDELALRFSDLVEVIGEIANRSQCQTNRDILKIYERWLQTGDAHLEDLLKEAGINTVETQPFNKPQ